MQITPSDIKAISKLVHDLCGIVLDESKGYLIESRLGRMAREAGCATFTDLCHKVRSREDPGLRNQFVDAITTNETLFFRDSAPWEALAHKALPEIIDQKANTGAPKRLRLWSAACSTGQEAYSIAMTLCELLPDVHTWDVTVLATDISDAAIAKASRGRYDEHEIQRGMRVELLTRYFVQEEQGWRVKDGVRALIAFKRMNLLEPFVGLGPFDVVFCRNVAIYFSEETRRDLFRRIKQLMPEYGYLFVGSTESLHEIGPEFAPHHHCRAVYYRPNLPAACPS